MLSRGDVSQVRFAQCANDRHGLDPGLDNDLDDQVIAEAEIQKKRHGGVQFTCVMGSEGKDYFERIISIFFALR